MASLMSMVHLAMDNDIPEAHIEAFLSISKEITETSNKSEDNQKSKPNWITSDRWAILVKNSLDELVLKHEKAWKEWNEDHSKIVEDEKPFYALMISMILDYKRSSNHLIHFVQAIIGFE